MKINKIQLNNFRFFTDDKANNTFDFDAQNVLIYGENGSGKSSIFKAFEFLSKVGNRDISNEFKDNKNLFNLDQKSSLEFEFNNNIQFTINDDTKKDDSCSFINNLYVTNPLLDYKKLLYVNFTTNLEYDKINLFPMLSKLFDSYPVDNKKLLKDIENPNDKLDKLKTIMSILLDDINIFLEKFTTEFTIKEFKYTTGYIPLTKNLGLNNILEFIINIDINFKDKVIDKYHNFLNEARLSSLAIAIYFAIIKHLSSLNKIDNLQILVLDDLLISLDMNNRLNLMNVLKSEFSDFQIFFLTHDKALFEIYKEKINCKAYEIYLDDIGQSEKPIIKKSLNYFQSAKKYFDEYDYPACANYLRKEIERIKKIKEKQELSINEDKITFKKIKKMLLSADLMDDEKNGRIIGKLRGFKTAFEDESDANIEIDLRDIKSITDRILNPQSHDDTSKPLYKKEIEEAIEIINKLQNIKEKK